MELKDLTTETAFIRTFWRELSTRRAGGSKCTHQEIFEELNDCYEEMTGEPRFPSFDAFRKCRDRRIQGVRSRRSK